MRHTRGLDTSPPGRYKLEVERSAHFPFPGVRGGDRLTLGRYLRLERSERTAEMVAEIRGLLDAHLSITLATEYARGIAGAAFDAFEAAFAPATAGRDRDRRA